MSVEITSTDLLSQAGEATTKEDTTAITTAQTPAKDAPSENTWLLKPTVEKDALMSGLEIWLTIGHYFWVFVTLGLSLNFMGPCMPELIEQTHSDAHEIGQVFLATGITYATGATLSGVILEHIPQHIHLFNAASLLITTVLLCSLYWVQSFECLFWTSTVYCLFIGAVDTSGNAAILNVMRERPEFDFAMQLLMAAYNLGSLVSPLIINFSVDSGMQLSLFYITLIVFIVPSLMISLFVLHPRMTHRIHSSSKMILADHNTTNDIKDDEWKNHHIEKSPQFCSDCQNRTLVFLSSLGLLIAMCLDVGFAAYITEFTLEFVDNGSAKKGRLLSFLYFGFGFLSRISAVLKLLSIIQEMLLASMTIVVVCIVFLMFPSNLTVIAVCTAIFGCAISPFFGLQFAFVESCGVHMTGLPTGILMLGAGIGASIGPALIGHLSRYYGWIVFPFSLLIFAVVFAFSLIPVLWLGLKIKHKLVKH